MLPFFVIFEELLHNSLKPLTSGVILLDNLHLARYEPGLLKKFPCKPGSIQYCDVNQ
jgi:hypothetical protein